jgi:hypothetical protein
VDDVFGKHRVVHQHKDVDKGIDLAVDRNPTADGTDGWRTPHDRSPDDLTDSEVVPAWLRRTSDIGQPFIVVCKWWVGNQRGSPLALAR